MPAWAQKASPERGPSRRAWASSRRQGRKLGLEELVRVDAHGGEVPSYFEADQAVQAAPDEDGAQGDRRVSIEGAHLRPCHEHVCERLAGGGGRGGGRRAR